MNIAHSIPESDTNIPTTMLEIYEILVSASIWFLQLNIQIHLKHVSLLVNVMKDNIVQTNWNIPKITLDKVQHQKWTCQFLKTQFNTLHDCLGYCLIDVVPRYPTNSLFAVWLCHPWQIVAWQSNNSLLWYLQPGLLYLQFGPFHRKKIYETNQE